MATNYPTSLDSYTDKVDNVSTVYATSVNNLQDAMAALQAKVGINDSLATSSLDYKIGNFFNTALPRQLFFYQSSPPVGWSTSGLATNCVVGVKGGDNAWNTTGGTEAGAWAIDDASTESHNHRWLASYGSDPWMYAWQSDGSTLNYCKKSGVTASIDICKGIVSWYAYLTWGSGDRTYSGAKHCYTSNTGHTHTGDGDWKPSSYVGIVAKYTGA